MVLKVVSGGNFNGPIYYQGTWDANANNPFLQSGVGFTGEYYIVSVAGNTNLDGITNWQVGDWAIFNSATNKWEKIDGGSYGTTLNIVNDSTSNTTYNLALTNSAGGLVDTEYVDNAKLTFNPSTNILSTPQLTSTANVTIPILANINANLPSQIRIKNSNAGTLAQSQFTAQNDFGTESANYATFGVNSSGSTRIAPFGLPNSAYLQTYNFDLYIGTTNSNNVHFVTNAQTTDAMTINPSNSVAFNGSYGTSGQVLISQGSSSAPIWSTPANGTVVSISAGTGIAATPNPITSTGTIAIANTTVTAGTYGNASAVSQVVINAQGQVTSASNVTISVPSGQVTGLGTMATQNSNNVTITGGSINVQTTNHTATTTGNATYATSSLLLVPAGFFEIDLNGTVVKVPYYAV